jgi:hypothetical protein
VNRKDVELSEDKKEKKEKEVVWYNNKKWINKEKRWDDKNGEEDNGWGVCRDDWRIS